MFFPLHKLVINFPFHCFLHVFEISEMLFLHVFEISECANLHVFEISAKKKEENQRVACKEMRRRIVSEKNHYICTKKYKM